MLSSRLNEKTGNPEILKNGKVIETAGYRGIALLLSQDKTTGYMVFSHYWEGTIPDKLIGRLIRIEEG